MNHAMMKSEPNPSPSEAYMELPIAKLCFYHTNDKGPLVTTKHRCYCIRSYYRGHIIVNHRRVYRQKVQSVQCIACTSAYPNVIL